MSKLDVIKSVWGFSRALGIRLAQGKQKLIGSSPSTIKKVATFLGVNFTDPKKLLAMAKNNKVATAMIVWELYGPASELWMNMVEEDPSVGELVSLLSFVADDPTEVTGANGYVTLEEEFGMISRAQREMFGGDFNAMLEFVHVMSFSMDMFESYRVFDASHKRVFSR
jgi:hypothetical protein